MIHKRSTASISKNILLEAISFSADVVDYCAANPSDMVASLDNCAHYYNCTERYTLLGNHTMECIYPDLFSSQSLTCQNFEWVQCGKKTMEPMAPCEYFTVYTILLR